MKKPVFLQFYGDDYYLRYLVTFDDAGPVSFQNKDQAIEYAKFNAGQVMDQETGTILVNYRGYEE